MSIISDIAFVDKGSSDDALYCDIVMNFRGGSVGKKDC